MARTSLWSSVALAVSLVAGTTLPGLGGGGTAAPRPLRYEGRILLVSQTTDGPVGCGDLDKGVEKTLVDAYQFESGSSKPKKAATFDARTPVAALSSDGRWAVTCRGYLHDLVGDTRIFMLPLRPEEFPTAELGVASVSPDSSRVAFTFDGHVFVYDIATDSLADVFGTASKQYTTGTFSGEIGDVDWLDPASLVVWHYGGKMPNQIQCYRREGGQDDCKIPQSDTYAVVSATGDETAHAPGSAGIKEVRGQTLLLENRQWIDLAELRAGNAASRRMPKRALRCLSPDGTHAIQEGTPWRLVDLRTGDTTRLGARVRYDGPWWLRFDDEYDPSSAARLPCTWSPDGRFVAAISHPAGRPGDETPPPKLLIVPATPGTEGTLTYRAPEADVRHLAWTIP